MAAQWEYRQHGVDHGPASFEELVGLIREGELEADDLVRRVGGEWQRIDSVVGLLRQARKPDPKPAAAASSSPPRKEAAHEGAGGGDPRRARQLAMLQAIAEEAVEQTEAEILADEAAVRRQTWIRVGFSLASMAVLAAVIFWVRRAGPDPFPPSKQIEFVVQSPVNLPRMRAKPPLLPTLESLPLNTPTRVPGINQWLKQPTLSHDLRTIVFVTIGGPQGDVLALAERTSKLAPFNPPRPLSQLSGQFGLCFPALSPDGLELIFTEMSKPWRLMYSSRESSDTDFEPPRPLVIDGRPQNDLHYDNPQFLGDDEIRYTAYDGAYTQRLQLYARRPARRSRFQATGQMPIANPWPRVFVSANKRRVYFPGDSGIQLTALHLKANQYLSPETLLTADVLGGDLSKFDDAIWVAPGEDLVFYCSSGPDAADPGARALWMVRF